MKGVTLFAIGKKNLWNKHGASNNLQQPQQKNFNELHVKKQIHKECQSQSAQKTHAVRIKLGDFDCKLCEKIYTSNHIQKVYTNPKRVENVNVRFFVMDLSTSACRFATSCSP